MQKVEFKKRNVRPTPASKKQPSPAIHPLKRFPHEKRQNQAGKDNCEVPMCTSLQHPGSGKEAYFSKSGSGRACKLSHEVTLQAVLNDTNLQIHGCLSKNAQCFKHADRLPASLPIAATYRRLKHQRIIGVKRPRLPLIDRFKAHVSATSASIYRPEQR